MSMVTVVTDPSVPMTSMGRVIGALIGSARVASDQETEAANVQRINTRRHVSCLLRNTCMHYQSAKFRIT
jgi:hypothetical protein